PRYFWGRPSSTTDAATGKPQPYAADNSGGSNLAPSNPVLINRVRQSVNHLRAADPAEKRRPVPVDLVTSDFSGLDPNISEAAALYQVQRVAVARGLSASRVRALVEAKVQGRILWVFGEPHINVLQLNTALDSGGAG
ncbi:MAG: potassium-transporting ATPase subunit C, partial [Candidatus Dormibacteraceae bacterium]